MIKIFSLFLLSVVTYGDFAQTGAPPTASGHPKKVALVIGAGVYQKMPFLLNPYYDAIDFDSVLKTNGFDVQVWLHPTLKDMLIAKDSLRKVLPGASVVNVYMSGHSIEVMRQNYFLPVDADTDSPRKLYNSTFNIKGLLEMIDSANIPVTIVLLDGCRTAPENIKEFFIKRQGEPFSPHNSFFIGYASLPKQASRGNNAERHSFFTGEFLEISRVTHYSIDQVFTRITERVKSRTKGLQTPIKESNLQMDFYLFSDTNFTTQSSEGTDSLILKGSHGYFFPDTYKIPAAFFLSGRTRRHRRLLSFLQCVKKRPLSPKNI